MVGTGANEVAQVPAQGVGGTQLWSSAMGNGGPRLVGYFILFLF